jgi:uncharacterized repeat protein (TIGR03803 family)
MKTRITNSFLLPAVIGGLGLIPAGRVTAQTFTTLHSFTATITNSSGVCTNSDGASPYAGLILSGNTLYGTAVGGGSSGFGTVFAVNTDGTAFTNLYNFAAASTNSSGFYTNSDGAYPQSAGLTLVGNTLYGTATYGGSSGVGTVFAINTDGSGFTNLHSFTALLPTAYGRTNSDGAIPWAGVIVSGNSLYGTAAEGGSSGNGTVFAVNTDGTGFRTLHSFIDVYPYTNSDGALPYAGLILSGNTLYGTARGGGSLGGGTVFAINTDGSGFTNLYNFTAAADNGNGYYTNTDGADPIGGLILSGNTLYGTTYSGGRYGNGTVFAINTDGSGFTNLHTFAPSGGYPIAFNKDGANPWAGVIVSGNTLYGTTLKGGGGGRGAVFALNTNGTGFTNLYSSGGRDLVDPDAGLIVSGNSLYGTTSGGGDNGTVFRISFRPQLGIASSGTNVILSWPISYAGFSYAGYHLEETANLSSPTNWISVVDTNLPIIVNGQIQVTRPVLGPQWSYRLRQ